jgi:manganese-dependent inorganic pyrophosphatase
MARRLRACDEGMRRPVYVVGHRNPDADSICSAIAYARLKQQLGHREVQPARAGDLDAQTEFVLRHFGVAVPKLLVDAEGLDLILVDHNEVGQALPRIELANILEVWEHHGLGDLRLPQPILFHCEPVGATATLVAEQYFVHGITPERDIAGLLLAAILSDTVLFRSPTTCEKDRQMVARLQQIAKLDPDVFGRSLLDVADLAARRKSPTELVHGDLKRFSFGDHRVAIAQVELPPRELAERKHAILSELRALCAREGFAQAILMVTDIDTRASELWFTGDHRDVFEQALGPLVNDAVELPGVMSRKQQVVPALERAFARSDSTRDEIADPAAVAKIVPPVLA